MLSPLSHGCCAVKLEFLLYFRRRRDAMHVHYWTETEIRSAYGKSLSRRYVIVLIMLRAFKSATDKTNFHAIVSHFLFQTALQEQPI